MMVIGSRNALKSDFDLVAAALRRGDIPMEKIVTHRTSLSDAVRDIPVWASQKQGLVKAMIAV
jgi:threonine dehydrogenase-like Zn-dependent dehydrogenase